MNAVERIQASPEAVLRAQLALHARWHALRMAPARSQGSRRFSRVLAASFAAHLLLATAFASWNASRPAHARRPAVVSLERRELAYAEVAPREPRKASQALPLEPQRELEVELPPEPELVELDLPPAPLEEEPAIADVLVAALTFPDRFASRTSERESELVDVLVEEPLPQDESASSAPAAAPVLVVARPDYRRNPAPEYPRLARQRRWEGTVLLSVVVRADGSAGEIRLLESSGHRVLDEAALDAVRSWNFVPALRGGEALETTVEVPVTWRFAR